MRSNIYKWVQVLFLGLLCCQAAPNTSNKLPKKYTGDFVPDQYIVKMEDGIDDEFFESTLNQVRDAMNDGDELRKTFSFYDYKAFSIETSSAVMDVIRAMPSVELAHPNFILSASAVERNSTYGLDRISHRENAEKIFPQRYPYQYDYGTGPGGGIGIYVIDSGVNVHHVDFGGRAFKEVNLAPSFGGPNENLDYTGHGTHVASIAAGTIYGVAKDALIYDVKVINSFDKTTSEAIVDGIQYAARRAHGLEHISVLNLSLGGRDDSQGRRADSLAVNQVVRKGLFTAVAAGNNGQDARNYAPANAAFACTVGNIGSYDVQYLQSNYGPALTLWAPGVDITAAYIGSSNREIANLTGTSMSCPHVAGVAAYLKSRSTEYRNIHDLCPHLFAFGTHGQVTFLSGDTGSPNVIVWNEYKV